MVTKTEQIEHIDIENKVLAVGHFTYESINLFIQIYILFFCFVLRFE